METGLVVIIITLALGVLLLAGVPVGFALGGGAVAGVLYLWGFKGLYMLANTAYADSTSFILLAVPLFIFMSNVLKNTGLADELYEIVYKWLGAVPGGLAAGTVVICAIFAAMAGISSVATISMGLIALPSMLKRGYSKDIATGCISAGGALGILIPPSIIMIIYGSMAEVSIGKLFMGGIIPGALMAVIFCLYILIRCFFNPKLGPPVTDKYTMKEKLVACKGVVLPAALIILVLGSIYTGAATPTEAAGIGALGSLICAMIQRRATVKNIKDALISTVSLNAMVLWIMIGAVAFTHVLAYAGVPDMVKQGIDYLDMGRWWVLAGMQLTFFLLGMVLDPAGIIMLTTPIFVPIVKELGFDPVWFGILFTINMEMAYITPPFGFNLFIMKGVVPPGIHMIDLYRSIVPFVVLQAICLLIIIFWPDLALWLPNMTGK